MSRNVYVRDGWTPFRSTEIDFSDGDFPSLLGSPHILQSSILPVIVMRVLDGVPQVRCIGTCFSISDMGLVVTAYHVVEEAIATMGYSPDILLNTNDQNIPISDEWVFGVLYWSMIIPDELCREREHHGGLLQVLKMWPLPRADLAVMQLRMMMYEKTGQLLFMPRFLISPGIPDRGAMCFGYGYHSSNWQSIYRDQQWEVNISQTLSASKGHVTDVFFPMRDTALLSFPSFATSARFDPGMSGGPILNERGGVIGIISVGLKTDEPYYIGYGTLAGQLLFIEVPVQEGNSMAGKFLFEWKGVTVDRTMSKLGILKTAEEVVIDFGAARLLRLRRRPLGMGS